MGQIAFLLGKIQDWHVLLIVAIIVVVAVLGWMFTGGEENEEEERENPEIIAEIERAWSAGELMDIVDDCEYFVGNENAAFLKKALQLDLCRHDWADVFDAAEEGSELERVAGEKAELD